jgi:ssDNA-binding Zn-finger/Zn-ribbon topoisomerase 1
MSKVTPKLCNQCGRPLVKKQTDSSWEFIADCPSCNLRFHVRHGDAMGGSSDSQICYRIPDSNKKIEGR